MQPRDTFPGNDYLVSTHLAVQKVGASGDPPDTSSSSTSTCDPSGQMLQGSAQEALPVSSQVCLCAFKHFSVLNPTVLRCLMYEFMFI